MGKIIAKVLVVLGVGTENVMVNGVTRLIAVRKEFQPGEEVTDLSDHDRRELLQMGAVIDQDHESAKALHGKLVEGYGNADFQKERKRVQQQRGSTDVTKKTAEPATPVSSSVSPTATSGGDTPVVESPAAGSAASPSAAGDGQATTSGDGGAPSDSAADAGQSSTVAATTTAVASSTTTPVPAAESAATTAAPEKTAKPATKRATKG